jgi:hypothetical protein
MTAEPEFCDVIRTKVLRVFLAIHSHLSNGFYSPPPPPSKSDLRLVCIVKNVSGNLKNSQDYVQKPQQKCMFMNSASGHPFEEGRSTEYTQSDIRKKNWARTAAY